MTTSAIYPGSFDPFTNGHLDMVRKASALFGRVVIAIGINSGKKRSFDSDRMAEAIRETLQENGLDNCEVCVYSGLVAEFAANNHIGYMIRGLRNTTDYNYEENIAEINKLINPTLEYVYFRAEHIGISSTMVRELMTYGRDVSAYVPGPVLRAMQQTD